MAGVTLRFTRLSPFGVEVHRDLAEPLGPSEAYHFGELLHKHGLIVARGQTLSMERQRALCSLLGPILDRAGEAGVMSNEPGGPAASALAWHSDAAYTEEPFDALSLHALDVVDDASSTLFVDARAAWKGLPDELRAILNGREQEMISPHYTRLAERSCERPNPEAMKRAVRPCTIIHPRTGEPCLWVSALQTARLLGMDWEDSRTILRRVFASFYAPDAVFEHRWRTGDALFWDNIALQHMRENLENAGPRRLQRVIVGTGRVAPHMAQA